MLLHLKARDGDLTNHRTVFTDEMRMTITFNNHAALILTSVYSRGRVNDWLLKINDVDLANKDRKQVIKGCSAGAESSTWWCAGGSLWEDGWSLLFIWRWRDIKVRSWGFVFHDVQQISSPHIYSLSLSVKHILLDCPAFNVCRKLFYDVNSLKSYLV